MHEFSQSPLIVLLFQPDSAFAQFVFSFRSSFHLGPQSRFGQNHLSRVFVCRYSTKSENFLWRAPVKAVFSSKIFVKGDGCFSWELGEICLKSYLLNTSGQMLLTQFVPWYFLDYNYLYYRDFNPLSANSEKQSNTLNNLSAVGGELFECVWLLCRVDTKCCNSSHVN